MDIAGGACAWAWTASFQRPAPRGRRNQPEGAGIELRELEANGFVSRTVTPVNPPQVEYALTELGREFLMPVRALAEWVVENSSRMDVAREAYLKRRAEG